MNIISVNANDPSLSTKELTIPYDGETKLKAKIRTIPKGKFSSLREDIFDQFQAEADIKKMYEEVLNKVATSPSDVLDILKQKEEIRKASRELAVSQLAAYRELVSWCIVDVDSIKYLGEPFKPTVRKEHWINQSYDVLSDESLDVYGQAEGLIPLLGHYSILFQLNLLKDENIQ